VIVGKIDANVLGVVGGAAGGVVGGFPGGVGAGKACSSCWRACQRELFPFWRRAISWFKVAISAVKLFRRAWKLFSKARISFVIVGKIDANVLGVIVGCGTVRPSAALNTSRFSSRISSGLKDRG
jgi:hypothetical protein